MADWKNDRVQKFSPDGKYLATFGRPGTGDEELKRPTDVAIDNEGDVYVTDWGNDRLNIYAPDGTFLTEFIGDAEKLSPWGQGTIDVNPDYQKARRRADLTPERRFKRPVAVNVDDEGMHVRLPRKMKNQDWLVRRWTQVHLADEDLPSLWEQANSASADGQSAEPLALMPPEKRELRILFSIPGPLETSPYELYLQLGEQE